MSGGELLWRTFLIVAVISVAVLIAAFLTNSIREAQLLALCKNQTEIAENRVTTCTALVQIDVIDGKVAEVYWKGK